MTVTTCGIDLDYDTFPDVPSCHMGISHTPVGIFIISTPRACLQCKHATEVVFENKV